jgi:hypothetical protein
MYLTLSFPGLLELIAHGKKARPARGRFRAMKSRKRVDRYSCFVTLNQNRRNPHVLKLGTAIPLALSQPDPNFRGSYAIWRGFFKRRREGWTKARS